MAWLLRSAGNKEWWDPKDGWRPPRRWFNSKAKGKWYREVEGRNCRTGKHECLRKETPEEGQFWPCLAHPSSGAGLGLCSRWACERLVRYNGENCMKILIQEMTRSEMHHHLYQAPLTMRWDGLCPCLCPPQALSLTEFYYSPGPLHYRAFICWMNERTNSAPQLYSPILALLFFPVLFLILVKDWNVGSAHRPWGCESVCVCFTSAKPNKQTHSRTPGVLLLHLAPPAGTWLLLPSHPSSSLQSQDAAQRSAMDLGSPPLQQPQPQQQQQ